LLAGLDGDEATQYLQWVYYLNEERKTQLLKLQAGGMRPAARVLDEHLRAIPRELPHGLPHRLEAGNRFSLLDVQTFLPDNLLEYSDKMSMAWALELRVPYLDPRVVEFAFRLPFATKLNRRGSKVILRETFADLIPAEHQRGPKKGFNVPLGNWMRTKLDRYFEELLPRSYVEREGIFNYDYIQVLRAEHQRGQRDNGYELFAILMFDAWYRKYVTGTLPRKLPASGPACVAQSGG
jgi:asparagine synthase (glutamine-hydrolysing)